jgi:hypothetical protein
MLIDGLPDRLGFEAWRLRAHLAVWYSESYQRDIEAAADAGTILKRIRFTRPESVDGNQLRRYFRTWTKTNEGDIWFSNEKLDYRFYVSASHAEELERYLSAAGWKPLNPSDPPE